MEGRCPVCKEEATAEGHDPCIANLPGVANACCGHGREPGYVHFKDDRVVVLRGNFQHMPIDAGGIIEGERYLVIKVAG